MIADTLAGRIAEHCDRLDAIARQYDTGATRDTFWLLFIRTAVNAAREAIASGDSIRMAIALDELIECAMAPPPLGHGVDIDR